MSPVIPLRQVRPSAEPSRLTVPREVGQAAALGAVAQGLSAFDKELERLDEIRANEATVELNGRYDALLVDPKDGLLGKRGTSAAEGLDPFRDGLRKARSDGEAGLASERQKALFARNAERLAQNAEARAMGHVQGETQRVDVESDRALYAIALNQSAAQARTGQSFADVVRAVDEGAATFADRQGLSKVASDALRQERRSAVMASGLTAMANTEDADVIARARDLFAAEQGTMTERDRQAVDRELKAGGQQSRAQAATVDALATHPNDEAAALAYVREKYDGDVEDNVVARVKARFAEREQQSNRADATALETVMQKVERTGDMSSLTSSELATIQRRGWVDTVQSRATQVRNGQPPVSEIGALEEIWKATREGTLKDVVPLTYRSRLNDRDYRVLNESVDQAKNGGGGQNPVITQEQVARYTFDGAKRLGLIDAETLSDLKGNNAKPFEALRAAVAFEVDRQEEVLKRNLSASELELAVRDALYARAMFHRNEDAPAAPRAPFAAEAPNARIRKIPPLRPNLTRTDRGARSLELLAAGMSPAEAMAQVLREIP